MGAKQDSCYKKIAENKRANFDYEILETFEAGVVLMGSELKSLRLGKASISEAHAGEMAVDGRVSLYLFNATITEYTQASRFGHEARRPRALLLHKKQINKLLGAVRRKGLTVAPLSLYFNHKGLVKVCIGLGRGRKNYDKRELIKERDWKKQESRVVKHKQHE